MSTPFDVLWGVFKHLATGYLIYSLVLHTRGRVPTAGPTGVLLVGTMFPDLIDKPLTMLGVVSYGRSFAHSLFTLSVILLVVRYYSTRWKRPDLGWAFALGYLSHIPVDMYGPLLTGKQAMDTAFLFWPVVVEYSLGVPTPEPPVARSVIFGGIMIIAACLWVYDGLPPIADLGRFVATRADHH